MAGILYIVATPIGNLEDITLRALRILREVDLIAAEDTRITRKILSHYDIHTPSTSYHQHSHGEKTVQIVERLRVGQTVALVADAGTPAISDPGSDLICLAIEAGIAVVPIPGANAALSALVASGLPTSRFAFEGFPPRTKTDRRTFFGSLRDEQRTVLLYESPGRLLATLEDLRVVLGERSVAVAREMTKVFEEVYRGTLSGAIERFSEKKPRGEFVIVVGPGPVPESAACAPGDIRLALQDSLDSGATPRFAVLQVSRALGLPRRLVYQTLLAMRK